MIWVPNVAFTQRVLLRLDERQSFILPADAEQVCAAAVSGITPPKTEIFSEHSLQPTNSSYRPSYRFWYCFRPCFAIVSRDA